MAQTQANMGPVEGPGARGGLATEPPTHIVQIGALFLRRRRLWTPPRG